MNWNVWLAFSWAELFLLFATVALIIPARDWTAIALFVFGSTRRAAYNGGQRAGRRWLKNARRGRVEANPLAETLEIVPDEAPPQDDGRWQ